MSCSVAVAKSAVFSPSPTRSPVSLGIRDPTPSPRPPPTPLSVGFRKLRTESGSLEQLLPVRSTSSSSSSTAPPAALYKRKRPGRFSIPVLNFDPVVQTTLAGDRSDEVVEVEGEEYSVYCKRGKKGAMEDRYSAVVGTQGDSKQALFGVFDGHGGAKAAEFAAKNLDKNIIDKITNRGHKNIEEAVKEGYLTTDAEFLREDMRGGACCVTALISKGELVVSNAGDCRAVMSRGGVAEALTVDHRPSREDERTRIENQGGYVDFCHGIWRIQGSLAVSRAIGDRSLKQWVVAEPDTRITSIAPDCELLVLASDGLWDKVTNQEAIDVVRPLCVGVDKPQPFLGCKKLVHLAIARGSIDDVSVMVIQLSQFIS